MSWDELYFLAVATLALYKWIVSRVLFHKNVDLPASFALMTMHRSTPRSDRTNRNASVFTERCIHIKFTRLIDKSNARRRLGREEPA